MIKYDNGDIHHLNAILWLNALIWQLALFWQNVLCATNKVGHKYHQEHVYCSNQSCGQLLAH